MSRLRVRIELNRGGVGVPLEKLASVVQQSQSFFRMLGDDVHIDQSQGDWLGFDFDHESLNFTAEFVGAVTQEQVAAFHAAFDGTTPLRRTTIAQFARIADAIEEDEVIGFGLYFNEGDDPGEWRCLSRRDALRIAEEIQLLLGEGQVGQESHLPTGGEVSTSARYMFGRRDRSVDSAKLTSAVREVEANLSKRISRLEGEVADHSGHIHDLRSKSFEAEQSMGRLLSAVEGFCEQAATRLESVATPALASAAAAGVNRTPMESRTLSEPALPESPMMATAPAHDILPEPQASPVPDAVVKPEPVAKSETLLKPEALSKDVAKPTASEAPSTSAAASPVASMLAAAAASPVRTATPVMTAAPFKERSPAIWWRSPIVLLVGIGTVVIVLGIWLWPSTSGSNQVTSASEPAQKAPVSTPVPTVPPPSPAPAVSKPAVKTAAVAAGTTHVELVASEPSWVSIRAADGTTLLSSLIEPGKSQAVDLRQSAVLRAGNAGGLTVRANGKSLGPLGPHGSIREVEFKNGDFKLVPAQ